MLMSPIGAWGKSSALESDTAQRPSGDAVTATAGGVFFRRPREHIVESCNLVYFRIYMYIYTLLLYTCVYRKEKYKMP
jgi:hypothetical protein